MPKGASTCIFHYCNFLDLAAALHFGIVPCGKISKAVFEPTANKLPDLADTYPHFQAYKGAKLKI